MVAHQRRSPVTVARAEIELINNANLTLGGGAHRAVNGANIGYAQNRLAMHA